MPPEIGGCLADASKELPNEKENPISVHCVKDLIKKNRYPIIEKGR